MRLAFQECGNSCWGDGAIRNREGNGNTRMSKPVENFYEFIWTKLTTYARAKFQMLLRIAVLQPLLCIWNWGKMIRKITWWWERARQGLDYRIVNKIRCSLQGGYAYFKGVLTRIHKNHGEALLKAKMNLLLKTLYAWALANVARVDGVSFCRPKCCRFNSWWGHMPGFSFSPQWGHIQAATNSCFFLMSMFPYLSLSFPSPLSKTSQHILG